MTLRQVQMANELETPKDRSRFSRFRVKKPETTDYSAVISERVASFLGTPKFLFYLTIFCAAWLFWNTFMPEDWRFDSADLGFTALTLILSLQASYAAPLILFAQNRQSQRDKVIAEQDRQRSERNLSDTEYLARELSSIKIALQDVATRDFVRTELRDVIESLQDELKQEKGADEQVSDKT
ncbi:MAG: DUF1003 domain-containing protein [Bifidobacteriaceae bacterium]|jgi:uncharacterized membrane protein|nr:DUF1003 domain-containing protein [Bifidobacteriaceae bacterium]